MPVVSKLVLKQLAAGTGGDAVDLELPPLSEKLTFVATLQAHRSDSVGMKGVNVQDEPRLLVVGAHDAQGSGSSAGLAKRIQGWECGTQPMVAAKFVPDDCSVCNLLQRCLNAE